MSDHQARLDEALGRFRTQLEQVNTLKDRIADLKGSARNADGSVTVTVAPSGAVLGLQLSPMAMQRSHTQLQQEILGTIRHATAQAANAMRETIDPILGDQAAQFTEAFTAQSAPVQPLGPTAPPAPSELPPPSAAQTPAPARRPAPRRTQQLDEDDDFFDGGNIRGA